MVIFCPQKFIYTKIGHTKWQDSQFVVIIPTTIVLLRNVRSEKFTLIHRDSSVYGEKSHYLLTIVYTFCSAIILFSRLSILFFSSAFSFFTSSCFSSSTDFELHSRFSNSRVQFFLHSTSIARVSSGFAFKMRRWKIVQTRRVHRWSGVVEMFTISCQIPIVMLCCAVQCAVVVTLCFWNVWFVCLH